MIWKHAVVLSTILAVSSSTILPFPPGFKFGAATAAYQVEGGWNLDGKSENIWDRFVHEHPERIDDRSTGDVACDSYHNWRRDLEMAEELRLDFYRFSLSWSRILPSGFPNHINEAAIEYYNNVIDGILEKGIEPLVTIHHFDLPQSLQDLGGWANPLIVDWFEDYAKVVFAHFGDRVKLWLTINEPVILCEAFFNAEVFPPAFISPDLGVYLCSKHVMLAHAKAWRVYDKLLKPKYHGRVSLTTHITWFEPLAPEYEELAELTMLNFGGRYSHAIYSKIGGWPPALEKALAEVSLKRGYSRPQLPPFTQEEIELVRGTYDFFALNHYTSRLMRTAKEGEKFTEWPLGDVEDLNGIIVRKADWAQAATSWFYVNPEGIRKGLVWLKQQYGDLEFMITENGLATKAGLDDQDRVQYYRDYLEQVLLAINEDDVNVTAYTAWTLMDNYEWNNGYTVKFGLYEVNFTDPGRKRTPRASAHYYANIIRTHSLEIPTTSIQL
ncbi:myrosinase 1-like isoform X1 [Spodoptera litura]|uniref:Myrosinase 1-like isoform X1 n=1 Tax=Spodoptera litura TaxID=69820 RepID=A0A9J7DYU9_SPOLT|nr:myrosinase 1-like isoform X1 [Spodoptera litura]